MDYLFTEEAWRRSLAGLPGVERIHVGFANFVGTFPNMPRPGVTYYPILAFFRVPTGRRFITFDQYRLESGITTLIYPVYRVRKDSIVKRFFECAMPACREWLEERKMTPRTKKTEAFCVYYDQTFDEVICGANISLKSVAAAAIGAKASPPTK
jgi:hypothetical protein